MIRILAIVLVLFTASGSSTRASPHSLAPRTPTEAVPGGDETEGSSTLAGVSTTSQQESPDAELEPAPLAPRHKEWLEEDAGYIIAPQEEAVFEMLPSDEARDAFIEAFWRARDPTPGTARNEARDDHYDRIAHANRFLARETPRPGWRTDRGRIYIQLGEPDEMQTFHDPKAFWPIELWFYRKDPRATGLPPFFYIMFFRPEYGAEWRLYDPFTDGPPSLAKSIVLQESPAAEIVTRLLQTVGYEPAQASVNLVPSEHTDFANPRPSLRNQSLFHEIQESPYKRLDMGYAMHYAANRGEVSARVAFAALPLEINALAFWDERGVPFLHYAVEMPPERVLLGQYDRDYYLSLEVGVQVGDLRGQEIVAAEQPVERHFDEAKANSVIRSPLAWYDRLDLVPGVYEVEISVTNMISNDQAIAQTRANVPPSTGQWALSDLLVASQAVSLDPRTRRAPPAAFRFNGEQFVPAVDGNLRGDGSVTLFAQLVAAEGTETAVEVEARGSLVGADGEEHAVTFALIPEVEPAPRPTGVKVVVPLDAVPPGPYGARLAVTLPGDEGLSVERPVQVLRPRDAAPPPEVLLAGEAAPGGLMEYRGRGWQHFKKGELAAAEAYFTAGLEIDPAAVDIRRALAQAQMGRENFPGAADTLQQLWVSGRAVAGDMLLLSKALRRSNRAAEAASAARQTLSRWPPTPVAWNTLAEALLAAGDAPGAADAYRSSLALDPEQPEVREALAKLSTVRR